MATPEKQSKVDVVFIRPKTVDGIQAVVEGISLMKPKGHLLCGARWREHNDVAYRTVIQSGVRIVTQVSEKTGVVMSYIWYPEKPETDGMLLWSTTKGNSGCYNIDNVGSFVMSEPGMPEEPPKLLDLLIKRPSAFLRKIKSVMGVRELVYLQNRQPFAPQTLNVKMVGQKDPMISQIMLARSRSPNTFIANLRDVGYIDKLARRGQSGEKSYDEYVERVTRVESLKLHYLGNSQTFEEVTTRPRFKDTEFFESLEGLDMNVFDYKREKEQKRLYKAELAAKELPFAETIAILEEL